MFVNRNEYTLTIVNFIQHTSPTECEIPVQVVYLVFLRLQAHSSCYEVCIIMYRNIFLNYYNVNSAGVMWSDHLRPGRQVNKSVCDRCDKNDNLCWLRNNGKDVLPHSLYLTFFLTQRHAVFAPRLFSCVLSPSSLFTLSHPTRVPNWFN